MIWRLIRSIALSVAVLAPIGAAAQTPTPSPSTSSAQPLKPAELDQLVAPIALYPDPLLAEVLMASTFPLDIVQAHRWAEANKNLNADQLKTAADKQPWDDSVKSLIPTPDVLEMMSAKLDWTQKLGDAVVAQQADVMDAIQRLRARAQANNKLSSTKEQTVTVKQVENKQVITIEPTDPNTVYVPYYDPNVVYGTWPYSDYPPYYYPPPYYIGAGIIGTGIAFGAGYALGRWASGGNYWGGNVNWNNNNLNINRPINGGAGDNWKPRVEHRQGAGNRGGREQGLNFRGSNGRQVVNPGAGRSNVSHHNRGGNRPNVGAGNNRPSAGTRPSGGGQRHKASTRPNRGGNAHHARPKGGGGSHRGAAAHRGGGGGAAMRARAGGGGGGHRAAGGMHRGGGGGRGGGGRRSDIRLKHDIVLLGRFDDRLGFYRFSYNGSEKAFVGVMAQEVQQVMPQAVVQGRDGYLSVRYRELDVPFESYAHWLRSGARIPRGGSTLPAY
jgi:Protein of unknown function (DUF3300)/Chaperone of endosialidase